MECPSCGSNSQAEHTAEMIIHFSGLKNLDKSGVWAFPKLAICLDCGFSHFTVPKTELPLFGSGVSECATLTFESYLEHLADQGRISLRNGG